MRLSCFYLAWRRLWCLPLLLLLLACTPLESQVPTEGSTRGSTPVIAPPPPRTATGMTTATLLPGTGGSETRPDTATSSPTPTATPSPTPTATAVTPTPTATPVVLPPRAVLSMAQVYQRMNNCAPTTTSMVLSTYGLDFSQEDMASLQKPNPADVNVTAEEVAESIRAVGLEAFVGYNGDIALVERLLGAGFPLITEEWIAYDGGVGHFRAVRGYDRERQMLLHNDSFYGPDQWRSYEAFLHDWKPFNNKYVVAYRPEQEAQVRELIGADWDVTTNYENLLRVSAAQATSTPADGYAWWGWGEALLWQNQPEAAINAFEQALASGNLPPRYLWYRYGYFEALNRVGRYEEVLALTVPLLEEMKLSEDIRYQRGLALYLMGFPQEARAELEQALVDNPRFAPAAALLARLE